VVLDAIFPYARDHLAYPDLLAEGLMPHKVQEIYFWGTEDVNFRSDITTTFDLKIAALKCHESQVREFKRGDPEEWLRQRSARWRRESFGLAGAPSQPTEATSYEPNFCVALRPRSLRRTGSTPHSAELARLELGLIQSPAILLTARPFLPRSVESQFRCCAYSRAGCGAMKLKAEGGLISKHLL
jgi:hypothetical protein